MSTRVRPLPLLATLTLSVLLAACASGGARPAPEAIAPAPRPVPAKPVRIGLALGGGAAKGFAHIGVIKMLEANGIRPDIVSGTSAVAQYLSVMPSHPRSTPGWAISCSSSRSL